MTYDLQFLPSALKEWKKLNSTVKTQFKNKLKERLSNPKVPSSKLRNLKDHYKIKLRASGYRLVYKVDDKSITVTVVAVNKRNNSLVYDLSTKRSQ